MNASPFLLLSMYVFIILGAVGYGDGATKPPAKSIHEKQTTIYVVSHEWHSGIVLPGSRLKEAGFAEHAYSEVGWGDADYYRAESPSVFMALRAAFFSNGSVIHVVDFDADPSDYFPHSNVVAIPLSEQEMNRLMDYILNTFLLDERGRPVLLGEGLYGESRFYRAKGDFHLFNNCNSWVAEALQSSGYPFISDGIFTSEGLYERLHQRH